MGLTDLRCAWIFEKLSLGSRNRQRYLLYLQIR